MCCSPSSVTYTNAFRDSILTILFCCSICRLDNHSPSFCSNVAMNNSQSSFNRHWYVQHTLAHICHCFHFILLSATRAWLCQAPYPYFPNIRERQVPCCNINCVLHNDVIRSRVMLFVVCAHLLPISLFHSFTPPFSFILMLSSCGSSSHTFILQPSGPLSSICARKSHQSRASET